VHHLRAADAPQLAAAFIAAERRPSSLEIVTLDERLAAAARKEGFVLIEEFHPPNNLDENFGCNGNSATKGGNRVVLQHQYGSVSGYFHRNAIQVRRLTLRARTHRGETM